MIKHSIVWFFRSLVSVSLAGCVLISAWAQGVEGDASAAFSEAYAAYTTAIAAGDQAAALSAAKRAYESGSAHFGRVDANTGALAINYGNMLALTGSDNSAAAELFQEADSIYEDLLGPNSLQRVEALLALASVQSRFDERLQSINAALSMHRAVAPDDVIAFAALQTQSAELLTSLRGGNTEAISMLEEALTTLERELGEDSPELVATLFGLGVATTAGEVLSRRQHSLLDRAIAITGSAASEEAVADLKLQIAFQINRQSNSYRDAMPYIRSAFDDYRRLFGSDHPKSAMATLTLGQALIAARETRQGIVNVEQAIEFYEERPESVSSLIRARQLLLSAYLREGDDARYDEQLMEIGRLSEGLSTPVDYQPIEKFAPVYPPEAARRGAGGYVILQYTVDEEGRTRDLVVVDSGSNGSERISPEMFHEAALESARKYRYIPRFENGVPVSVPGITTRIVFELAN